jgi:hypothetical protein
MTEKCFKFYCSKCGSDGFIKIEHVELQTCYYNPSIVNIVIIV